MMQPPFRATDHTNAHTSLMQRIMLSAKDEGSGGSDSACSSRSDRLRDDIVSSSRSFPSRHTTFTSTQQANGEASVELWPGDCADGFSSSMNVSGYGVGMTMFPNMPSPPQLPVMYLRCAECAIGKTSSEEMEVHIKMEHLQWLPFQCPICSAERASDLQMREHIHSAHRKSSNKFIYVDNPGAKRMLQILMDKSLSSARRPNSNGSSSVQASNSSFPSGLLTNGTHREKHFNHIDDLRLQEGGVSGTSSPPTEPRGESPMRNASAAANGRHRASPTLHNAPLATATVLSRKRPASSTLEGSFSGNTNTDALLSAIRAATHEGDDQSRDGITPEELLDDDDDYTISQIFGKKKVKNEYDGTDDAGILQSDDVILGTASGEVTDHDAVHILGNVAAMFNAEDVDTTGTKRRSANGVYTSARSKANSSSLSKKRVLGECSKCKKPVTAGARQMHMFFHLGKDYNIYRFKCKFPDCNTEHYRKDQMENHHSKQHGKIDPNLMEDRTAELSNSCQELSLELLGTTGNTPGPTAARAQIAYDASIAAQALNQGKKKKKSGSSGATGGMSIAAGSASLGLNSAVELSTAPPAVLEAASKLAGTVVEHSEEQTLECRLCHKLMYNRIRGFHILWHMAKDLGINRYACRFCDFGHDRSQSVQTHGKKEHGVEDCVEDRIEEYSDEVKSMSESCFGFQALFSQDSRRRSKIPMAAPPIRVVAGEEVHKSRSASASGEHNDEDEDTEEGEGDVDGEQEDQDDEDVVEDDDEAPHSAVDVMDTDVLPSSTLSSPQSGKASLLSMKRETPSTAPSVTSSSSTHRNRKAKNRRFGIRKPASRLKRKEMAKLREMSMKLGGAQYFKKKLNEAAHCEKCGVLTTSRMSDHAYKHMDAQLFLCPHCDLGNHSREMVVRHIKDMHGTADHPIDDRLRYAAEIKEMIRQCYPAYFIDAPIPTAADIEKLKNSLEMDSVSPTEHTHEENADESMDRDGDDPDHDWAEETSGDREENEEHEDEEEQEEDGNELDEEDSKEGIMVTRGAEDEDDEAEM